jgi:hypothetical protein
MESSKKCDAVLRADRVLFGELLIGVTFAEILRLIL